MGSYEWDGAPPTFAQRALAGAFVIILLILGANSYFDWRMLGSHDRQAVAGWTIVGLVLFVRFMPGVRRAR